MAISEKQNEKYKYFSDLRLTKISTFSSRFNTWVFLDPNSLSWIDYDDSSKYVIAPQDFGLLYGESNDPKLYISLVKSGEVLYYFMDTDGSKVFSRFKTETDLFKSISRDSGEI